MFLLGGRTLISQNNIIPNNSFEQSYFTPYCQYPSTTSGANRFDNDMYLWQVARHTNHFECPHVIDINILPSQSTFVDCLYTWFAPLCNNSLSLNFSSHRFMVLERDKYIHFFGTTITRKYGATRVALNSTLQPGQSYILRMKVIPFYTRAGSTSEGSNSHLRVFFSKWHNHWDADPGTTSNELFEAINAEIILPSISPSQSANFQFIEREIIIPSDQSNLDNFVLYEENNSFAIDDVELFEQCPSNIVIKNQLYDYITYAPGANQGTSFAEQASNTISAGNYGAGNVQVQAYFSFNAARVTYSAGQKITLSPGFKADNNSYFHAVIASCPNNIRSYTTEDTTTQNVSDVIDYNYPNDTLENNISDIDTLYCPTDTTNIGFVYNNDSSGTEYSYHWNFGNGVTSTLAHPKICYGQTGTYTATLIVNDTSFTDTIIEQVIVLPCDSRKVILNNNLGKQTQNGSNGVKIWPNPNNGSFQISITKNNKAIGVKEIKVMDMLGKEIWQMGASSNNVFNIDILAYAQGVYYVRVVNEQGEIEMKKLIKE